MVFGWFKKKKQADAPKAAIRPPAPAPAAASKPAAPPPAPPAPPAPQPQVQPVAQPTPQQPPAPQPAAQPAAAAPRPQAPWGPDQEAAANQAIGALRNFLLNSLKTDRGVQAETLLVSAGALSGFSVIHAVFEAYLKPGRIQLGDAQAASAGKAIVEAKGADGRNYYFGDVINSFLVATPAPSARPFFVWGYLAGIAINAGVPAAELPDINEMFQRAASTVGGPEFGIPRMPPNLKPMLTPRQAVERLWPAVRAGLGRTDWPGANGRAVDVEHWPILCAIATQQLMGQVKGVMDMKVALRLVMESAIFMSKIDPRSVPQEMPKAS